ncbi:MAG: L,D-transpeptidase, partial [Sciscionella sp.]
MRIRHLIATATATAAAVAGAAAGTVVAAPSAHADVSSAPCAAAARACIDLSTQQAWLTHDGRVTYGPVPVRTGMASAPT